MQASIGAAKATPYGFNRFRQTEVQHFHAAVGAHLDVCGLEVAMDDAELVRGFERVGNLSRDGQCVGEWDSRGLADHLGQRGPLDQFHDDGVGGGRVFEPVDVRDVGMIEGAEHLRLALEPRQSVRVVGQQTRQHLQCDVAIELRVPGPIHLSHAAFANQADNFVGADAGART